MARSIDPEKARDVYAAELDKKRTAKEAYTEELKKIETKLNTLNRTLRNIRGNGTLSDRIHWGHVTDLSDLSDLLEDAALIKVSRVS